MRANTPSSLAPTGTTPAGHGPRHRRQTLRRLDVGAVLLAAAGSAAGYTVSLTPAAPQEIYLQVGVGAFTKDYNAGGQPQVNATINTVSTTLAVGVVGNGTAQAMTTNSSAAQSYWDGFTFCTVPAQLYIGGFFRTAGATTAAAQVTATVPAALTDATGDSIPFSQISWTSSGISDPPTEPFPAGTFVSGGVQSVGSMASNTWNESCWNFSYLNTKVTAAGTYTGAVLYTMTAP